MKAIFITYFFFTSFMFISCLNKHKNVNKISESKNQYSTIFPDTLSIYLFDNKLNKIPILCSYNELIENMGESDTIIKNRPLYIHSEKKRINIDKIYYWNLGIIYSSYHGQIRLQRIDLSASKANIKHEKIVLNENTSIKTIEKQFANSFSCKSKFPAQYLFGDSIINSQNLLYKEIYRVPFFSGESDDDLILLYFIDNKLRIIEIDAYF